MRKTFGLLFCLLILTATARAWDDAGHKVTAHIAWSQMTPGARDRAIVLLSAAPENSHLLTLLPTDSRSFAARRQQMFVTASTWADLIRDERFPERRKNYHRSNWHYTNIFWRQVNGRVELANEFKAEAENAVERLYALEKALIDASQPESERAIALAWILHLVGDIHQPLHSTARVTELEPKGDQGGNLFLLTPADAPRERRDNLHSYWDGVLTRNFPRENEECDSDYIPQLAQRVVKKHPAQKFADQMKGGKYDDWAQEGFQITSQNLYQATLVRNQAPPENYRKQAVKIGEERLALAGYRMAEMLNRIFGS